MTGLPGADGAVVALGLASAAAWGVADFGGGLATRRGSAFAVTLVVLATGLVLAAAVGIVRGEPPPGLGDLGWSVAAGIGAGIGISALYRGLAVGPMGIVAPLTGVTAALVPVLVGVALEGPPGPLVGAGIGAAIGAVVLATRPGTSDGDLGPGDVSLGGHEAARLGAGSAVIRRVAGRAPAGRAAEDGRVGRAEHREPPGLARSVPTRIRLVVPGAALLDVPAGVRLALAAGLGLGSFNVFADRLTEGLVFGPLVVIRAVEIGVVVALALALRSSLRLPLRLTAAVGLVGVADMAGNALFILAAQAGRLDVAAVLSSLYPVVTVLLAVALLRERLGPHQLAAVGAALAGIVLISIG
ncbi:MAG TPA: EamA family transporter [Candidatus Limnocylindrales bacterium]|nr:EamA family transporter [Candidatus Limnocylindrales bacterium]